jgi:hypothetical protein
VKGLEHNLKDLINHEREFNDKEAYAYTILSPDKSRCIGCLYFRQVDSAEFDCRVDFWFRDSDIDLEGEFFEWLKNWLICTWKIETPCFPARTTSWEDYYLHIGD